MKIVAETVSQDVVLDSELRCQCKEYINYQPATPDPNRDMGYGLYFRD